MPDRREVLALVPGVVAAGMLSHVASAAEAKLHHAQGEMAGEVTATSVLLQSRLTASAGLVDGDVPGAPGVARFEYATHPQFDDAQQTPWQTAKAERDFIVRAAVKDLKPGTTYYYRLRFGHEQASATVGPTRRFRTLPPADRATAVRFAAGNCMNYSFFMHGPKGDGVKARKDATDRELGYPGMAAIGKLKPDFFVGMGDLVYYDHPAKTAAKTLPEMRRKWHEQFVMPRIVELLGSTASYWMKDDHDYRYNDADRAGERAPAHDLGLQTFREQMPVVAEIDSDEPTYRTHRVGQLLQVWMVEGRDYRSGNKTKDGPEKTLWGARQLAWLKETILASDAPFKLLLTPTPLVGPDDAYKTDNHANEAGFRMEGEAFLNWLKEHKQTRLIIITGDRHWHYHSIHPSGVEEFSVGAFNVENARLGRAPGDPKSTDPQALVKQPYTDARPTGGFLLVDLTPATTNHPATLRLSLRDEQGQELYGVVKG